MEAEYIALATVLSHTVGIVQFLQDFSFSILESVPIWLGKPTNNSDCLEIIANKAFGCKTSFHQRPN